MKPNIELTIDKLVLEGFSRNEAFYIGQSVQAQLQHLIETNHSVNTFSENSQQRQLFTSPIQIKTTTRPENVGKQIAQSIYNGLSTNTTKKQ